MPTLGDLKEKGCFIVLERRSKEIKSDCNGIAPAEEMVPELTARKTSADEFRWESDWACWAGCCSVSCRETPRRKPWPSSGRQQVTTCMLNRSGWAQQLQSLCWKRKGLPWGSLHVETKSCTENGPEGTQGQPEEQGWNPSHLWSLQPRRGPCISKVEGLSWFHRSSEQIPASHKQAERDGFGQLLQFLHEKGMEEWIMTSKMTKQQSSLCGVRWVWTLELTSKSNLGWRCRRCSWPSFAGRAALLCWGQLRELRGWVTASKVGPGLGSW